MLRSQNDALPIISSLTRISIYLIGYEQNMHSLGRQLFSLFFAVVISAQFISINKVGNKIHANQKKSSRASIQDV